MTILAAGVRAPDFRLHVTPDGNLALPEFRGKPVILAFYPADWSPVCGDQMALYNEILTEFQRHARSSSESRSTGTWCHAAFADAQAALPSPRRLRAEGRGRARRTASTGRSTAPPSARSSSSTRRNHRVELLSPVGVNPGADGILDALESQRAGRRGRRMTDHPQGSLPPPVERRSPAGPRCAGNPREYGDSSARTVQPIRSSRCCGNTSTAAALRLPQFPARREPSECAARGRSRGERGREQERTRTGGCTTLIFDHQRDADALDARISCDTRKSPAQIAVEVKRDLDAGTYEERVKADFMSGVRSGVNGTPTFFINGQRFEGDWRTGKTLPRRSNAQRGVRSPIARRRRRSPERERVHLGAHPPRTRSRTAGRGSASAAGSADTTAVPRVRRFPLGSTSLTVGIARRLAIEQNTKPNRTHREPRVPSPDAGPARENRTQYGRPA